MNAISLYSSLPYWLQNVAVSLHGYKLKKQRFNDEFFRILDFLDSTQGWSCEQIRAYKEKHLYKIIEHAYNHCPFYRKKYSDAGLSPQDFKGLEDLQKFPILTKEEVRAFGEGMVADNIRKGDLVPFHTSGSTGKPLNFFLTKYSVPYYWAVDQRYKNRFGFDFGKTCLNSTGRPVVPVTTRRPPYWRYDRVLHRYFLNAQQISADKIMMIAKFLNQKNIEYFIGYPSIMTALASELEEAGLALQDPPKHIFTGAEKIYPNQVETLQRVFQGVQIHELYSFSEQAAIATHCKCGTYHEDIEFGHMELENPQQVKGGMQGNILATGFMNYGMPFIRYQNGDTAMFAEEKCACGLNSQVIKDILGRVEDYIITPEGVHIQRFASIFTNANGIKEAQVVQRKLGEIVIRIVRRGSYLANTEKALLTNVAQWISPTIEVKFEYVDEIPRTKAGKFKAVVSELNKQQKSDEQP